MDDFQGKRVFVSGGAGVIGSILVEKLLDAGAKIFVGDIKPRPKHWPKEVVYWHGDLNQITPKELLDFAPEYYFHLAATFQRSTETPDFWTENYQHNVRLSHYLLNILKDCESLQRIVFASSYLIYDPLNYLTQMHLPKCFLLSENSPINPRNLCGVGKLLHERELEFLHTKSSVSARIFRVYGKNSRDIISRWIQSLIKGEPITVYAKEGSFDFIYADDVAEGLLRLALSSFRGHVNLGRGSSRRIEAVLLALRKHFPAMKVIEENSAILYENSEADITLFKQITHWEPEYTLRRGIEELVKFYRAQDRA